MWLRELEADRLRNLKAVSLSLPAGLTFVVGRNGQGKTSLLESVYLLATGRSFRTRRQDDLLSLDGGPCRIAGVVESRVGRSKLAVLMDQGSRHLVADGSSMELGPYLGRLDLVDLTGERMKVLRGGPEERRRFLDRGVVGLTPGYLDDLGAYRRVLQHRNALLRQGGQGGQRGFQGGAQTGLQRGDQRGDQRGQSLLGQSPASPGASPATSDRGLSQQGLSPLKSDRGLSQQGLSPLKSDRGLSQQGLSPLKSDRGLSQQGLSPLSSTPQSPRAAQLDAWDERLVSVAARIHRERRRYAVCISARLGEIGRLLLPADSELCLAYRPSPRETGEVDPGEFEAAFAERLAAGRGRDLTVGHTCTGPHRDELRVELDGTDLRRFGSAGQVRAAMIALKLAKLSLLKEERGEAPLFLMDDFDSDLDEVRASSVADYLHKGGFQALAASSKETLIGQLGVAFTRLRMDEGKARAEP